MLSTPFFAQALISRARRARAWQSARPVADAYRARTGRYSTSDSGPIAEADGETWLAVDMALRKGLRGMPGGSSLAGCWPPAVTRAVQASQHLAAASIVGSDLLQVRSEFRTVFFDLRKQLGMALIEFLREQGSNSPGTIASPGTSPEPQALPASSHMQLIATPTGFRPSPVAYPSGLESAAKAKTESDTPAPE